jgi:translation elongation factor EF-Tu-like GTPase
MDWHVIEAKIRYLTPSEGGRQTGVFSGYRGQFFYDGEDYDGIQLFPECRPTNFVELGVEVRAFVQFLQICWEQVHQHKLREGMSFKIREGSRTVGEGTVTRLDVTEAEWSHLLG